MPWTKKAYEACKLEYEYLFKMGPKDKALVRFRRDGGEALRFRYDIKDSDVVFDLGELAVILGGNQVGHVALQISRAGIQLPQADGFLQESRPEVLRVPEMSHITVFDRTVEHHGVGKRVSTCSVWYRYFSPSSSISSYRPFSRPNFAIS